ncbi:MAG: hypothetical protein EOP58_04725 [Sphingomonadales bacterium]|nr:MAG: hypothetical protein EOP58_04725 [Sphingomonadales bacterium]
MSQEIHTSRRKFIAGGIATAAAVSLSACDGGAVGGLTALAAAPPLSQSEIDDWEKLVGATFVVVGESGKTTATLAALERSMDLSRPSDLARHQPFYAFFETDLRTAPEGNKTYRITHASRTPFDLFIGKIAEARGKGVFVAVFN